MVFAPSLAAISIPTAGQCLAILAPFLAVAVARWVLGTGIDLILGLLFPSEDWDREMGWLNLKSERRASAVLRWIGYVLQAALALALYGIAWGAVGLWEVDQWSDPAVLGRLAGRVPVLLTCLAVWLFYLFGDLLPRLRREYEREELEKFRAEQAALEADQEAAGPRRPAPLKIWSKSPLPPPSRSRR
jgi:hypothetical protein